MRNWWMKELIPVKIKDKNIPKDSPACQVLQTEMFRNFDFMGQYSLL